MSDYLFNIFIDNEMISKVTHSTPPFCRAHEKSNIFQYKHDHNRIRTIEVYKPTPLLTITQQKTFRFNQFF